MRISGREYGGSYCCSARHYMDFVFCFWRSIWRLLGHSCMEYICIRIILQIVFLKASGWSRTMISLSFMYFFFSSWFIVLFVWGTYLLIDPPLHPFPCPLSPSPPLPPTTLSIPYLFTPVLHAISTSNHNGIRYSRYASIFIPSPSPPHPLLTRIPLTTHMKASPPGLATTPPKHIGSGPGPGFSFVLFMPIFFARVYIDRIVIWNGIYNYLTNFDFWFECERKWGESDVI